MFCMSLYILFGELFVVLSYAIKKVMVFLFHNSILFKK